MTSALISALTHGTTDRLRTFRATRYHVCYKQVIVCVGDIDLGDRVFLHFNSLDGLFLLLLINFGELERYL